MKTTIRVVLVTFVLALLAAPAAFAQMKAWEGKGFVSLDFAAESASSEFDESKSWSLYGETATFRGTHKVGGGNLFISPSGGVRVWRNFGVGVAFSTWADSTDVALSVQVPSPLFVNQMRAASASVTGLEHRTTAVHLQALYVLPLNERILVTVSAGPTFFSVKQDRVSDITGLAEGGVPFNTVTISGVTKTRTSKSKTGFNVGADVAYYFTKMFGASAFFRYAATSVDLPAPTTGGNSASLDVGGLQVGGGLRVRF